MPETGAAHQGPREPDFVIRRAARPEPIRLPSCWSGEAAGAARLEVLMRGLLLWLVGVPLPLVLLLAFCTDIV